MALVAGAVAALGIGWLRPSPRLLALLLGAVMSVLWFYTVATFLRADAWMEANVSLGARRAADRRR